MSRIKISEKEKNHIRNLQESDNVTGYGTSIWGTTPSNPKLQEQIKNKIVSKKILKWED
tara:strand:+ start:57 stop:233 length:177 start_codon:yes stop_codon:yes gene_type:complete